MFYAAARGDARLVRLLLKAQDNADRGTSRGIPPLFIAAKNGYADIVELLLEGGAQINSSVEEYGGVTPLYIAAMNGHADVVRLLLAARADIEAPRTTAKPKSSSLAKEFLQLSRQIASIQPNATKLDKVPALVYANPPYAMLPDATLAFIKKIAENPTKQQLKKVATQLSGTLSSDSQLKAAEYCDWVCTLNFVNKHMSVKEISLEFLKELHKRLGRLTIADAGSFRKQPVKRNLREFDNTESVFWEYLDRTESHIAFFEGLEEVAPTHKPFCRSPFELLLGKDRFLEVEEERYILTASITRFLNAVNHPANVLIDPVTLKPYGINMTAADDWEAQEKGHNPNYRPGFVDRPYWMKSRMYIPCTPDIIDENLKKALKCLSMDSLHPIEKAADFLLNMVCIQPFDEANQRIGRIVANLILGTYGYPPLILTGEDLRLYTTTLLQCLDHPNGYIFFTQYIADLVKRTQLKYADQL